MNLSLINIDPLAFNIGTVYFLVDFLNGELKTSGTLFFVVLGFAVSTAFALAAFVATGLAAAGLAVAGAVFVVDPVYINRNSILVDHVVETDAVIETFKEYQTPFAIEPPVVDKRIKSQCGKFIYFGFKLDELDSYEPFRDKLVKVQIPNSNKSEILEELIDLGLSHKTIYPDVEGFARYAKHLMEKELNERMNQEVNQRNAPNGPKISPPHEARYC